MPDLNLIDEGGLDESSASASTPAPAPMKKSRGGGGGGSKTLLIVLVLLIVAAAAVYFLNKRGIIKLWGKKAAPAITEMQEEFPADQMEGDMQEAIPGGEQQVAPSDTQHVALLETPPVDEYTPVQPGAGEAKLQSAQPKVNEKGIKPEPLKPQPKTPGQMESVHPDLATMTGEFTAQVSAFRERSKADEVMQNLTDAGYPAFVQTVPMKGSEWYTVCIGRYTSRDEVKKSVENAAEQIRSSYVVARVRAN